jgi:HlyD family secretion protein
MSASSRFSFIPSRVSKALDATFAFANGGMGGTGGQIRSAGATAALVTIREFQSETEAIRQVPEPPVIKLTLHVMTAFVLIAVIFMFATKLDRVVTSQGGKIVPVGQVNVFQALDTALIKSIDVREGDRVEATQLLATLDPTFAAADANQLRLQIASLEAQFAREDAELNGKVPVFPARTDADSLNYAALQQALFRQRWAQYSAQIASFNAKISATQATIAKFEGDDAHYQQRDDVMKKIEAMRSTLAEHGTGSQLNLYVSQDARLEVLRNLTFAHNSLLEAQNTLASFEADRNAFVEQWHAQLSQEHLTTQNKLDDARSGFEKAAKHQDLVRLTATAPSVVLSIAKLSVGSVLRQGDPFLTLMPLNTPMEAEIKIASRDVGFARPNDPCVLNIDAFNASEHGTAEGKVLWVSDGAFTTSDDNQVVEAYYKARCSIDRTDFRGVPANFRLIPGMTLTGDIKVGKRSVAMYLLGGMIRGISQSMREP